MVIKSVLHPKLYLSYRENVYAQKFSIKIFKFLFLQLWLHLKLYKWFFDIILKEKTVNASFYIAFVILTLILVGWGGTRVE